MSRTPGWYWSLHRTPRRWAARCRSASASHCSIGRGARMPGSWRMIAIPSFAGPATRCRRCDPRSRRAGDLLRHIEQDAGARVASWLRGGAGAPGRRIRRIGTLMDRGIDTLNPAILAEFIARDCCIRMSAACAPDMPAAGRRCWRRSRGMRPRLRLFRRPVDCTWSGGCRTAWTRPPRSGLPWPRPRCVATGCVLRRAASHGWAGHGLRRHADRVSRRYCARLEAALRMGGGK